MFTVLQSAGCGIPACLPVYSPSSATPDASLAEISGHSLFTPTFMLLPQMSPQCVAVLFFPSLHSVLSRKGKAEVLAG